MCPFTLKKNWIGGPKQNQRKQGTTLGKKQNPKSRVNYSVWLFPTWNVWKINKVCLLENDILIYDDIINEGHIYKEIFSMYVIQF